MFWWVRRCHRKFNITFPHCICPTRWSIRPPNLAAAPRYKDITLTRRRTLSAVVLPRRVDLEATEEAVKASTAPVQQSKASNEANPLCLNIVFVLYGICRIDLPLHLVSVSVSVSHLQ